MYTRKDFTKQGRPTCGRKWQGRKLNGRLVACAVSAILFTGCSTMRNQFDAYPSTTIREYPPVGADSVPRLIPRAVRRPQKRVHALEVDANKLQSSAKYATPTSMPKHSTSKAERPAILDSNSSATTHVQPAAGRDEGDSFPIIAIHQEPAKVDAAPTPPNMKPVPDKSAEIDVSDAPLLSPETPAADRYPVNLGTALQLAGANNLQIALATERVRQAFARLQGAEVLWIPSLNLGVGYNSHIGQLQATEGEVVEVNRESVFVGGGPALSGAPLTGAAGGPARFFVDISPVDIFFEPLAQRQALAGASADESVAFNDTLLEVTLVYLELVQAQSEAAIAQEAVRFSQELLSIAENHAAAGAGLEADAERARTELADRRRQFAQAQERIRVVSAELARLLRLQPDVVIYAVDDQPVPMPLIAEDTPLDQLIAQGQAARPELARQGSLVVETRQRVRQEKLRPWLPNLHAGLSSGGFGGGPDDDFGSFSDRTDFDLLAVWQFRNLGLGNRSLRRQRESEHRQAHLEYAQFRDRVAAEVTQAYQQVQQRKIQIEQAETQVKAAARALPLNFRGIRGRVLRVIEAQQAIAALAEARNRYLAAVVDYNQAQFALIRALGQPPQDSNAQVPVAVIEETAP